MRFTDQFPHGFKPIFHPERVDQPLRIRKPSRIFVCSMGDFWGPEISKEDRQSAVNVMARCPQHQFIILTKRPELIDPEMADHPNMWIGVTVDSPGTEGRLGILREKAKGRKFHMVTSLEPILGPIKPNLERVEAAMLGGQTNPDKPPKWEWVEWILAEADRTGTKIFMKDNLCAPPGKMRREYPEELITRVEDRTVQKTL